MFFKKQFSNLIEWNEFREDMIFWKHPENEIKKGSRLIIKPGQDAIFLRDGKIEGIFEDEGDYDIESEIIPFLSTLKGFKFGFNTGMRAEVLFVNTKEFTVKWGTQNPINMPVEGLPGGMPIRSNGSFNFKVDDYIRLLDKIAGVRNEYFVEDVKLRITSILDGLLMKWIVKEGRDMFNLQSNASDIGQGILEDLDMQVLDDGLTITGFNIMSFNYPKEIQDMINKNASHTMVGDLGKFQQVSMTEGMTSGKMKGGMASDMAGMMMGGNLAKDMMENMNESSKRKDEKSKFCSNCGSKASGGNFCTNCGEKL